MSPSLKAKAVDISSSASPSKELRKSSSKLSYAVGNTGIAPANANTSSSGQFLISEAGFAATSTSVTSDEFLKIDGIEKGSDCYNDSSGEYENQKDKRTNLTTSTPRSNEKREKIRQQNEKKHQRQRERRAQELHERCTGFLMSRKLDFLTEKLVGMGFAVEHATRALILNDGKVEESVLWLIETGTEEEDFFLKSDSRSTLKIDISDELAKIAALEFKFKCSRQHVERAVVHCKGDLEKTTEILKAQKQEQTGLLRAMKVSDDNTFANGTSKTPLSPNPNPRSRLMVKSISSVVLQQQAKIGDRDENYSKNAASLSTPIDLRNRPVQPIVKLQSRADWPKINSVQNDKILQQSLGRGPTLSYSVACPLDVEEPVEEETHQAVTGGGRRDKPLTWTSNEPVMTIPRSHHVNMGSNSIPYTSMGIGEAMHFSTGLHLDGMQSVDMYKAAVGATGWGSCWQNNGGNSNGPSLLSAHSSLGLFTGWNSGSPRSTNLDWSMVGASMPELDYTSIDWTMDPSSSMVGLSSRAHKTFGSWSGTLTGSTQASTHMLPAGVSPELGDGMLTMESSPYMGMRELTSPFAVSDIFSLPRRLVSSTTI